MRVKVVELNNRGTREDTCDLLKLADRANSRLRFYLRPDDKLKGSGALLQGGVARFGGLLPKALGRDWGFALSGDDTHHVSTLQSSKKCGVGCWKVSKRPYEQSA